MSALVSTLDDIVRRKRRCMRDERRHLLLMVDPDAKAVAHVPVQLEAGGWLKDPKASQILLDVLRERLEAQKGKNDNRTD